MRSGSAVSQIGAVESMFKLCLAPGMLLDDSQNALGRGVIEDLSFRGYRQGMGIVLKVVVGVVENVNVVKL